jgi:aspartate-semialdehyde dehydrogenase
LSPAGLGVAARAKRRVVVLGATGAVGQRLITRLAAHPWFELVGVAASERSIGKTYGEAAHWLEERPLPREVADLGVREVAPGPGDEAVDLVFSALDATVAREVEPRWAELGVPVFSNASAFRQDPTTPLLVPEVNGDHLELVRARALAGRGFVVCNPNCSVTGLVLALKPLADAFGLEAIQVTTLQAISGAGYPGVPSFDILGNVVPWIGGEDEKIEREPKKILGRVFGDRVEELPLRVSAQANRVPVLNGHLLSISVALGRRPREGEVVQALREFTPPPAVLTLPSSPRRVLEVDDLDRHPQPRLHADRGGGMTVSIGRVRECPVLDVRFVALVHNTVRGAAGGALLNAEWATRQLAAGNARDGRTAGTLDVARTAARA